MNDLQRLANRVRLGDHSAAKTLREELERHVSRIVRRTIRTRSAHTSIARQILREVERLGVRVVFVADAVQAALGAFDAVGIGVGVLVAVVPVVPVEDVQAPVGTGFLDDRHEPRVIGRQEIGEAGVGAFTDPADGVYRQVRTFGRGKSVTLQEFPDVTVAVNDILPPRRPAKR